MRDAVVMRLTRDVQTLRGEALENSGKILRLLDTNRKRDDIIQTLCDKVGALEDSLRTANTQVERLERGSSAAKVDHDHVRTALQLESMMAQRDKLYSQNRELLRQVEKLKQQVQEKEDG